MNKRPVIILHNVPSEGDNLWKESDRGILDEISAASKALDCLSLPYSVNGISRLKDIKNIPENRRGAAVINLVERLDGPIHDFTAVPSECEAVGHPCTGGTTPCLALTLDKWKTKQELTRNGVPVPPAVLYAGTRPAPVEMPPFPVIVKPACSDGSEGITRESIFHSPSDKIFGFADRIAGLLQQPVLIEQFIQGREFNMSLIEQSGKVSVLPAAEIDFTLFPGNRPHIVDYDVKWIPGTIPNLVSPRKIPADIPESALAELAGLAVKTWNTCGCNDYARIDFRCDRDGNFYVLEVNANPDISPRAGFPASLAAAGIPFHEFLADIITNAENRFNRKGKPVRPETRTLHAA